MLSIGGGGGGTGKPLGAARLGVGTAFCVALGWARGAGFEACGLDFGIPLERGLILPTGFAPFEGTEFCLASFGLLPL